MTHPTSSPEHVDKPIDFSSNHLNPPTTSSDTIRTSDISDFFTHTLELLKSALGHPSNPIKAELFHLHERIAWLETELLQKQCASDTEIHFLQHKLSLSEKDLKASNEECQKLQKHRRLLFQSKEQLQKKIDALEEELKAAKSNHSTEITELKDDLLTSENNLKSLQITYDLEQQTSKQKVEILQNSIKALENEVEQLQLRCKQYADENQALTHQLTEQQSRLDILEQKWSQQPILELRSAALDLRAKEMDRQQRYVEQLEIDFNKSQRLCSELQTHRSQVSVLEEEKLSLKQKVKALEMLRTQLLEREAECESLRAQMELWDTHSDWTPKQAQQRIESLEKQLNHMLETEQFLQQRLETHRIQKDGVYADLERLQQKHHHLDQQHWTLYTQNKTLENILLQKEQEISDLKEQVHLWTQFTETSTLSDSVRPDPLVLQTIQRDFNTEALKFKLSMELLFGYSLVQMSSDQIVVRSAYGSDSETFSIVRTPTGLKFGNCSNEETQVKYEKMMDLWKERQCISGFLSTVTLSNLKGRFKDEPEVKDQEATHEEG